MNFGFGHLCGCLLVCSLMLHTPLNEDKDVFDGASMAELAKLSLAVPISKNSVFTA